MSRSTKPAQTTVAPSASGGPATFRGTDYQIDCAVLRVLEFISRQLAEPLKRSSITLEPREVKDETVTRWDIRVEPPAVLIEAKINLSKRELEEFLSRVGEMNSINGTIELAYGEYGTSLLTSLKRLNQIAIECGSNESKFTELVNRENIPSAAAILQKIGTNGRDKLGSLSFNHQPESPLKREIESRARALFAENPARLIDALSRQLRDSAKLRRQLEIGELVESLENSGVTLARPTKVVLSEIAPAALTALAMLQALPTGLPEEVVCDVTSASADQLQTMLSGINWASVADGVWFIRFLPFEIPASDRSGLLRRTFESLLHFLSRNETDSRAEGQLKNAVSLAQSCLPSNPELALLLFQATEHIVKNLGDKHLLLDISNMCISAASRENQGIHAETCARARAQAWLCGISWVYQRTGRLPEARFWADKSLELGVNIGWDRNTAFSNKCMGRLDRMEAELESTKSEERPTLLKASAGKLKDAIAMFTGSAEFGPSHRQVGDCNSLLARTFLVSKKREETEAAMQEAYRILTPDSSKEFADLLILTGDYEVEWGSREDAEERYTEVVENLSRKSREHSEIYARALTRRARNRAKLARKRTAISDFERAAIVWRDLGEHDEAAKSDWERIEIEGTFDPGVLRLFASEPSGLVRLLAFNMYREQLQRSKALAHRARPNATQVSQYLREARKRVALDYPDWCGY